MSGSPGPGPPPGLHRPSAALLAHSTEPGPRGQCPRVGPFQVQPGQVLWVGVGQIPPACPRGPAHCGCGAQRPHVEPSECGDEGSMLMLRRTWKQHTHVRVWKHSARLQRPGPALSLPCPHTQAQRGVVRLGLPPTHPASPPQEALTQERGQGGGMAKITAWKGGAPRESLHWGGAWLGVRGPGGKARGSLPS